MAKGKKPPNQFLLSDIDPLSFLEVIEAYAAGATVEPDSPFQQMTAMSFARVAEGAVYQHRANLPNGRVGEYTLRAQKLMENALAEACFSGGVHWTLAHVKSVSANEAESVRANLDLHDEEVRRNAARQCALILKEIAEAARRKGVKGRPPAASGDDKLALWDSMLLRDAVALVAPGKEGDRDAISEQIPTVARTYLRLGQLPWRGETLQDCVDIHSDRVRRRLDGMPKTTKDFRGFSIKRREQ